MSRIVDNLIALKMLKMLITPFDKTKAFKLGIIDASGSNLIKPSKFSTGEQKNSYSYLERLIFTIKRFLNKLPGGDSNIKNLVAAYYLVKETYQNEKTAITLREEDLINLVKHNVILVEEQISVKKFLLKLQEDGEGGAPTNSACGGDGDGDPVSLKNKTPKSVLGKKEKVPMARRVNPITKLN